MGDDEQFTEFLNDSSKDFEFRNAVRLMMEQKDEALAALIMIRNEFRIAPKPCAAFMADKAVKVLDKFGIS